METLEDKVSNQIAALEEMFDNEILKGFEAANKKFENLVKQELVTRRGHHLLSPSDKNEPKKVTYNFANEFNV